MEFMCITPIVAVLLVLKENETRSSCEVIDVDDFPSRLYFGVEWKLLLFLEVALIRVRWQVSIAWYLHYVLCFHS